jgi:hypothetical protein
VVNIGNGLGQFLFLMVTLSSGQEDWSALPDNHSFEAHSCEQFHKHSLRQTHPFQVSLCLVME